MNATVVAPHPHRRGSAYFYDKGCRCDECREGKRSKRQRARERARAELRPSYQRELEASLARKQSIVGTCEDCGTETRYNGHTTNGASRYCPRCGNARAGAARRGTGPKQRSLHAFLEEVGQARFVVIAARLGITANHATALLNREVAAGRIVRVSRGKYALAAGRVSAYTGTQP